MTKVFWLSLFLLTTTGAQAKNTDNYIILPNGEKVVCAASTSKPQEIVLSNCSPLSKGAPDWKTIKCSHGVCWNAEAFIVLPQ